MKHTTKPAQPAELSRGATSAPSAWGRFVDGSAGLGSVLIAAMMVLVCADVILRSAFGRPIAGATELVALSIVAVLFLQLASALRHGRLSRAELLIDPMRARWPRLGAAMNVVLHLAGSVFCGVVAYASLEPVQRAWSEDTFIGTEGIFTAPVWPVLAIVLLGAAATAIQFLVIAASELRSAAGVGKDAL